MSYNAKVNRTFRINGSISIAGTQPLFVQGMDIEIDANSFQRDFTGSGDSVFTQNGDIIGTFSFNLKNTVDLFSATATATDTKTVSYWMQQIADLNPPEIVFIQNFVVGDSSATGNAIGRITFTGRVMSAKTAMDVSDAVEDVPVTGEVITLTQVQRVAS